MSKTTYETVTIKGIPIHKELPAKAAVTILPGIGVVEDSTGALIASVATVYAKSFALENGMLGDDIDHAYEPEENVHYGVFRQGDEVSAILAQSQTIAIGAILSFTTGGFLKAVGSDVAVAIAKEAVTTTSAEARIVVEIL